MALRRTTLILLIVLGLVIAGGAVLYFMFPDAISGALNNNTNTTANTNTAGTTNTNTSAAPTNLSTSQVLSGDTTLTATVKVGTVDVKFTSLDRLDTFSQNPAPANKEYIVLYFEGLDGSQTNAVFNAFNTAQLVSGEQRFSRDVLKVAANIVKNDRGYISFLVPTGTKNLSLEVGSGADVQTVKLP